MTCEWCLSPYGEYTVSMEVYPLGRATLPAGLMDRVTLCETCIKDVRLTALRICDQRSHQRPDSVGA